MIIDYCEEFARLPGLLGRARPEFGPDYRTITFGSYVIIMRYADEDAPRSHLYSVHVIHGSRDLDAFFSWRYEDQPKEKGRQDAPASPITFDGHRHP